MKEESIVFLGGLFGLTGAYMLHAVALLYNTGVEEIDLLIYLASVFSGFVAGVMYFVFLLVVFVGITRKL